MNYKIAEYPQDKYRFALYDNINQLSWQAIKKQTGCYALVNLWYFALVAQPSAGVKYFDHQAAVMLSGVWALKPTYDYPGICVDRDGHMTTGYIKDAVWGYAASVTGHYVGGKPVYTKSWTRNGVTYTGIKADGTVVILLSAKDDGMTSAEAVKVMQDAGCVDILRWDGSWSSQGSLGPGMDVQPSQRRICRGWLLVYPRDDKTGDKPTEATAEDLPAITQNFLTKNDCYSKNAKITPKGLMIHSVGVAQPSAAVFLRNWNKTGVTKCVHGIIDGNTGDIFQTLPWEHRGWHAGTGSKGSANDTHIGVEMCEPATIKYTGGATFTDKDPAATKAVVLRTYNAAVKLFAALCKKYNLNPYGNGVITSHRESHVKGLASNHGDPEHLWSKFGLTMDGFRKDIKAAMTSTSESQEPPETPAPDNPTPDVPEATETTYTVKKGDTLSGIAARYGMTYQSLAGYNNLPNPHRIVVGQVLRIPGGSTIPTPTPAPAETVYTVRKGDTLSGIAARYGLTYQALASYNGLPNPSFILVGQKIKIPTRNA